MLRTQLVDNLEMISFYAFFVGMWWGWCEFVEGVRGCMGVRIVEDGRRCMGVRIVEDGRRCMGVRIGFKMGLIGDGFTGKLSYDLGDLLALFRT